MGLERGQLVLRRGDLRLLSVKPLPLGVDLRLHIAVGRLGHLDGLTELGQGLLVALDLVGQVFVGLGQRSVVGGLRKGVGERVGGQDLLQNGRLIGLVGGDQTTRQDLLADIEFALFGVLFVGQFGEVRLEQNLLRHKAVEMSLDAGHLTLQRVDLRLGVVHRREHTRQVPLGGGDLTLQRGLLPVQLGQLRPLVGDQLRQTLLLGNGVGERVRPNGCGRRLNGEAGREQSYTQDQLKEPPATGATARYAAVVRGSHRASKLRCAGSR